MQIRVGYEPIYDCPQPTPMNVMLNIHCSRTSDILVPAHLVIDPPIPAEAYRGGSLVGFTVWVDEVVAGLRPA